MLHSLLVIDGDEEADTPFSDGQMVVKLANKSGKFGHVAYVDDPEQMGSGGYGSQTMWTMVWFTGHVTRYQDGSYAFERKRGREYTPLVEPTWLGAVTTKLLVLAGCNTDLPRRDFRAEVMVQHKNPLKVDVCSIFTLRFMQVLLANMRRDRLDCRVIDTAFYRGVDVARAMQDRDWKLVH